MGVRGVVEVGPMIGGSSFGRIRGAISVCMSAFSACVARSNVNYVIESWWLRGLALLVSVGETRSAFQAGPALRGCMHV